MEIELKSVTANDEPYVWHVYQQAMRALIEQVWGWNAAWQRQNFKLQLETTQACLVIYKCKQIGYVQFELEHESTFVDMIALEPEYRLRGIGPTVINEIARQKPGPGRSRSQALCCQV